MLNHQEKKNCERDLMEAMLWYNENNPFASCCRIDTAVFSLAYRIAEL
jgi:hypothetical protein